MTPSREAVRARTLELIQDQTTNDDDHRDGLTLGARNFDSLDVVELAIALDDEFQIEIRDDLWGYDTTVAQVVADVVLAVCGERP